MIKWYADETLAVLFSEMPEPDIRFATPKMTSAEKKEVEQKPFVNNKKITVFLFNHKKSKRYTFEIEKGYTWDGASIPRLCWRIIGAKTDNRFLIPSMVHDVLCENKNLVDFDRYFADRVFEKLLSVSDVGNFKRWLMFHSVDNFQKFQGWEV